MPTKRKNLTRKSTVRITRDALEAFEKGDHALHRALGLKPWEISPLDATGSCPYPASTAGAASWPQAVELRKLLEG